VIEMDTPQQLLLKQDGIFSSMVQSTGAANSQHLYQIVMSNFEQKLRRDAQWAYKPSGEHGLR
jgi:hypothetical protein